MKKNMKKNIYIYVCVCVCTYMGTSSGEGHGKPLQYSCLENPMHKGAWQATVHRAEHS